MEDKRKNLRRHIKAATDWLQQADKSIEQKDDLKGDLKLMLAKAELKNAEKHQNHSRINKILSLATAAAIAFGVLYIGNDSKDISTESPTTAKMNFSSNVNESKTSSSTIQEKQIEEAKESLEEQIQTANVQAVIEEPDYIAPLNETNDYSGFEERTLRESSGYIESEINVEEPIMNADFTSDTPKEPDRLALEARTPTEDMQKLMQSAGQILRAE